MTRLVAAAALTDADFYPEYCDLDIDPNEFEGTTRERFIHILSNASPKEQAATVYSPGFRWIPSRSELLSWQSSFG